MSDSAARVAARFLSAKTQDQAERIAKQAERTLKKLEKLLFGRTVVTDYVDVALRDLHAQYVDAEKIARLTVDKTEAFLKGFPDDGAAWELKLLKDNLARRSHLTPEGPKSSKDFSTTGDGPMRRKWTSEAFAYARNLEGGAVSYARAVAALDKAMHIDRG